MAATVTEFKLNGITIKRPHKFSISRFNLTKSDRTGDGTMAMEIIAKKRKFFFTYNVIDNVEKQKILDIIWEGASPWVTLSYVEDGVTKTATVYAGEIPSELARTGNKWYWKDFNFNLIEK